MLNLVEDLGGWPSLNSTWNEDDYNWIVPAAASTLWYPRVHGSLVPRGNLFGVKPDRDFEDTSKYILYVSWPHLITKQQMSYQKIYDLVGKILVSFFSLDMVRIFGP